jgi:CheY-like chemotaxis protein
MCRLTLRPKDRSALANLKALVVDDNLVAQQIMTGMLQGLGWEAFAAEGPEDALAMVTHGVNDGPPQFDVIFLDWDMPGMDGLTLAGELSKLFGDGPRPIMIMVTASGRDVLNAAPRLPATGAGRLPGQTRNRLHAV